MTSTPHNGRRGFKMEPLYYALAAVPAAIGLEFAHAGDLWIFLASCVAIIPLAGLMGRATENLAETMGAGVGGLLNATFGNAAELIIAIMLLRHGPEKFAIVKASLTGSILGNALLVLGLAIVAGGVFHKKQVFNRTGASMGSTLLALAAIGLIVPTLYFYAFRAGRSLTPEEMSTINWLSDEIAVVLMITYLLSLFFSLVTHHHIFGGPEEQLPMTGHHQPEWGRKTSLLVLAVSTALVALIAEFLVSSMDAATRQLGLNEIFVGVIVVAVIGNAAEHSTAVLVAMKDKMDLSVNIAIGSSIQIALFVAPVLVFVSLLMGHSPPLDLHFSVMETITIFLSVIVLAFVSLDGETNWFEGVMLLAVYAVFALAFFHLPPVAW